VAFGQRPHPLGEVASDGHRQQVGVRTRPRTARHVPLYGAFGRRLAVWVGCLPFAPLLAPVGATCRPERSTLAEIGLAEALTSF
jgi:hypothetical protein